MNSVMSFNNWVLGLMEHTIKINEKYPRHKKSIWYDVIAMVIEILRISWALCV